jgi:hypothetical protein
MQDTAIPKKMYGKLYATRRRGRPKTRWLDDVSTYLRKMGINEWRDRAREAYCNGGQGPPRAVAPQKKKKKVRKVTGRLKRLMYRVAILKSKKVHFS